MICWRCHLFFDPEPNDIRPSHWHVCPDGKIAANFNPDFNNHRRSVPKGVEERGRVLRRDYGRRVYDGP